MSTVTELMQEVVRLGLERHGFIVKNIDASISSNTVTIKWSIEPQDKDHISTDQWMFSLFARHSGFTLKTVAAESAADSEMFHYALTFPTIWISSFCMHIYSYQSTFLKSTQTFAAANTRDTLNALSTENRTKTKIDALIQSNQLNSGKVNYAPMGKEDTLECHTLYKEKNGLWFIPASQDNVFQLQGKEILTFSTAFPDVHAHLLEDNEDFQSALCAFYLESNETLSEPVAKIVLRYLHLWPEGEIAKRFFNVYSSIQNPHQLRFNSGTAFVQACIDTNIADEKVTQDYQGNVAVARSFIKNMPHQLVAFLTDLHTYLKNDESFLIHRAKYFDAILSTKIETSIQQEVLVLLKAIYQLPCSINKNGKSTEHPDRYANIDALRRGFFKFCTLNEIDINDETSAEIISGALYMQARPEKKYSYFSFAECIDILERAHNKKLTDYAQPAAISLAVTLEDAKKLFATKNVVFNFNTDLFIKNALLYFASVLFSTNSAASLASFSEAFQKLEPTVQETMIAKAHLVEDKSADLLEFLLRFYNEKQNAEKFAELVHKNVFLRLPTDLFKKMALAVFKILYQKDNLNGMYYFNHVLSDDERNQAVDYLLSDQTHALPYLSDQITFKILAAAQQKQVLNIMPYADVDDAPLRARALACKNSFSKSIGSDVLAEALVQFFARIDTRSEKKLTTLDKIELYYILDPYMSNKSYEKKELYKDINQLGIYVQLQSQIKSLETQYQAYCSNDQEHAAAMAAIFIRQKAAKYLFENHYTRLYIPTEDDTQAQQMIDETQSSTVCRLYKNYLQTNKTGPLHEQFQELQKSNTAVQKVMSNTK